jgi:hypothetical protein
MHAITPWQSVRSRKDGKFGDLEKGSTLLSKDVHAFSRF